VALLKASNRRVFYVPTLYTYDAIDRAGQDNPIPESERERARRTRSIAYEGFRRALAAGLPIGFATDASVFPHGQNAKELSVRVRLGESPMAAIVSATSLNAEIIGWQDDVGRCRRASLPTSSRCLMTAPGHLRSGARRLRHEERRDSIGMSSRAGPDRCPRLYFRSKLDWLTLQKITAPASRSPASRAARAAVGR
jgi:hypothetical protein